MTCDNSLGPLKEIEIDDGFLVLETVGTGPITLFIHGLGEGRYAWRHLLCHPEFGGRRVSFDLRGHGDSVWNQHGVYTIEQHADDLEIALMHLPQERFVIVGHSMGGEIAIRAAGRGMANLCGVILVDCSLNHAPELLERLKNEQSKIEVGFSDADQFRRWLLWNRPLIADSLLDQVVESALKRVKPDRLMLKRDPRVFDSRASELRSLDHGWAALKNLTCPLLILRGAASSYLSTASAQSMKAQVPSAEILTVPNSGHGIALENPEGLMSAMLPFLSKHLW